MSNSRRTLLRLWACSLAAGLAGCSGTGTGTDGPEESPSLSPTTSPSPARSSTPTATTECEAVELPRPTPTAQDLEPLSYPDYPGSLTAETAREFAAAFERAYQHNRFLAGNPGGTDVVLADAGVPDGFVIEDGDGYLVGVNATIATEDNRRPASTGTDTPTAAPSYDGEFAAWYHVGPRRVRRKEAGSDLPATPGDVDMSHALTVRCV